MTAYQRCVLSAVSFLIAVPFSIAANDKPDQSAPPKGETFVPDAGSKQKLKKSQRAWLAFRDAETELAADQARGGSMAPTIRYATMTELTQQRIKQLKTRLTGNDER